MFRFLFITTLFFSVLTSCKTANILRESRRERKLAASKPLDSLFLYNPAYEYKIRKNDKISISVWGQDELSVGSIYGVYNSNEIYGKWLMVDAHGIIEIPKIGSFNVLNYTVTQFKDTLQKHIGEWIKNPIVDVKILNKEITIIGEVRAPQVHVVDKDRNSLIEIITKSGGFEFYADLKHIKIIRPSNDSVVTNVIDISKSGNYFNKNIQVYPGDIIIVPSKRNKEFDKRVATIVPFTASVSAFVLVYKLFTTTSK
jgi:polysaccharide export outer membrane protein